MQKEYEIERLINEYINLDKNNTEELIQKLKNDNISSQIFFFKMGSFHQIVSQNPSKNKRFFTLIDNVYEEIPKENFKNLLNSDTFKALKEYFYQKYFQKSQIQHYEKKSILKWYDHLQNDENYDELVQIVTEMDIQPGDFKMEFQEQFQDFKKIKTRMTSENKIESQKKLKDIFDRLNNEKQLQTLLSENGQELFNYLEMKDQVELIEKSEIQEKSLETLKTEVKKYRIQLEEEVEKLKTDLIAKKQIQIINNMKFAEYKQNPSIIQGLILFSYFRSSSSWRVRTILNIKQIPYNLVTVNLLQGEQLSEEYKKINPMGQVPAFYIEEKCFSESMAIANLIEDKFPNKKQLIPSDPFLKAQVLEICEIINSGIQPLQNLKVLKKIESDFKGDKIEWGKYWNVQGLTALNQLVEKLKGKFCVGDEITLADCFFVPQFKGAIDRFKLDPQQFPYLFEIFKNLDQIKEFKDAYPQNQPDFV